ncbi:MAG: fumarylacetoacetate hydrolase family protein [Gammaproteobacteria bacterium]|nr:fumarylacetoacetate hydrolase family protein [Gammaproteobacteria bacterium]
MKLASLKYGRDGQLVVVSRDLQRMQPVTSIATTMQAALDSWSDTYPALSNAYRELNENQAKGLPFKTSDCAAPLPRAYQWADGSAYVNHVELVRKARGAELPDSFWHDPLMYQGGSDQFIGPNDNIEVISEDWGIDFEAEITVIADDVPMGVTAERASDFIRLFMLVNDVSLRNLIPGELAKGFGFFQSKPSSAFSPVAVTPDELGNAWDGKKLHLPLIAELNGNRIGAPNAGVDMTFDFPTLIAHAAKSRPLGAGIIIGSGTISNRDRSNGSCCLAEIRMLETINQGEAKTPFMKFGDRIKIEMLNANQESIFGAIDQTVSQYTPA